MKKFINVLIMILIIVGFCVGEQVIVQNALSGLKNKTAEIEEIYFVNGEEFSTELQKKVEELNTFWEKKESQLCLIINHCNIEEVGEEIDKLQTALSQNENATFLESLNLIKFYNDAYQHILGINFQNLL